MKKVIKFFSTVVLVLEMIYIPIKVVNLTNNIVKVAQAEENGTKLSEKLSDGDWKIELNEGTQKGEKEFDFIQKNINSDDLADNGHFLLIIGTILVNLAAVGVIFFSICLYKLCSKNKKRKKRHPQPSQKKHLREKN